MPAGVPTWLDGMVPASFRDVPFFVAGHEMEGGRNNVVFAYPQQDRVYVEDLGKRARIYEIKAFVVGDDYMTQRDALLDALEQEGDGTLVHPYFGSKTVSLDGPYRVSEGERQAGMATLSLRFIESAATPFAPLSGQAVDSDAIGGGTMGAASAGFAGSYQTTIPSTGIGLPSWAYTSAAQTLTDWSTTLQKALSPVVTETQALSTMKTQLDALVTGAALLVKNPLAIVTQLGIVMGSLLEWPDTPRLGLSALIAAYNFTPTISAPAPGTAIREAENGNYVALVQYVQTLSIVAAVKFAVAAVTAPGRTISTAATSSQVDPAAGYDSYQDALAVRATLMTAIDALGETADDATFAELQDLRAQMAVTVPGTPNTLPELETFTPLVTVPALVLSQRLYGNISLADDLVTRNAIQHPGFVPGGQALQVLSHA